jgi:hypothetical protein
MNFYFFAQLAVAASFGALVIAFLFAYLMERRQLRRAKTGNGLVRDRLHTRFGWPQERFLILRKKKLPPDV